MSFFEIFEPGLRHSRGERDRQKSLVVRPTTGGGAPLGIDLDNGTAVIHRPEPAQSAHQTSDGPEEPAQASASHPPRRPEPAPDPAT